MPRTWPPPQDSQAEGAPDDLAGAIAAATDALPRGEAATPAKAPGAEACADAGAEVGLKRGDAGRAAAANRWGPFWIARAPDESEALAGNAVRSPTGFVGLANPGCVCYMNATNQQLFMVPAFRRGMLAAPWAPRGQSAEELRRAKADSVLHQLQCMFASLQESEQAACSPAGLCMALKDWDGNPVNMRVQDDAAGYFSKLFQSLENSLSKLAVKVVHPL